jgi:hypothetical protein
VGHFDRRGGALEEPPKRRQRGSRLADLGDRIARTFSSLERSNSVDWQAEDDVEYQAEPESTADWQEVVPRFPIVRSGYDCALVDEHVADLERELAEVEQELSRKVEQLQTQASSQGQVADEIHRIGQETSGILLAAHDKAAETTRRAQAEAERCVADAAANAVTITEEANRKLRQVQVDTGSLSRDRAGLLQGIRDLAGSLCSLADSAEERFPVEPAYPESPETARTAEPPDGEAGAASD